MDLGAAVRRRSSPVPESSVGSEARPASANGQSQQQPVKRRRMHTACKICQDRKTRCDGTRPTCSTCLRRGVAADCVYDIAAVPPASRVPSSLAAFEERLGRLEQTRIPRPDDHARVSHTSPLQSVSTGIAYTSPRDDANSSVGEIRMSAVGLPTPQTVHEPTEVDGLATVATLDNGDCLYGASSTIALTRFFRGKAAEGNGTPADIPGLSLEPAPLPSSDRTSRSPLPELVHESDVGAALYPSRPLADDFVLCFWEFVHPLFPVLHKTSFMHRYRLFWTEQGEYHDPKDTASQNDHAIFTSTLNIIFSLGCQFSTMVPAHRVMSLAQDFYQRARRLYNYEVLDSMSLPLVQMLLLTGVYLQSAQNANRCWNIVGLAIRAAQGMGLHVERPKPRQTQLDREMQRRIWHCCLVLDRLLSMTFGRPVMISERSGVPIPSLIDDDYLRVQGEGCQPVGAPSGLGLLAYSSKLFLILDDILLDFYSSNPGCNVMEMTAEEINVQKILSDIMARNRRLEEFLDQIPAYLRYDSLPIGIRSSPQEKSVEIQRQILYCRFLYTRLLLFRPVVYLSTKYPALFLSQYSTKGTGTMDDHLVKLVCDSSVQAAAELISALHRNLEHSHRSSAWHSIYFTFGAAVLLLCTQICPAVGGDVLQRNFEESWQRANAILDYYKVQRPVARQSIKTLQALRDSLQRHQPGPDLDSPAQRQLAAQMDLPEFDLLATGPGGFDAWFSLDMGDFGGFH
ncbi:hypothetical protein NLU13_4067 [Sarocladium strictum]|uniref:Zn(2)-C6 fungal-type domain-containing protein n=1 Tax=Sarocladium strictum TaxID=5046 RepID=A0AA39GKQ7_SARSR|nr:hypothetical protein NLU13_4067 [Sarocladium strictum]